MSKMRLCIGMFFGKLPETEKEARRAVELAEKLGATSVETYVGWKNIEPESGRWEWDQFDYQIEILQEAGLLWVPFLIAGPWYLTPDWFKQSEDALPYVCLEHSQESGDQSIWNPNLRPHIQRVITSFCSRYGNKGCMESLLLGISGDYGEAQYPAHYNWLDQYHSHLGYWCGDHMARESFQKWLQQKYDSIQMLSSAWNKPLQSWEEIRPCLPADAPSPMAWLDQTEWYESSITQWADFWLQTARKSLPSMRIELCAGGFGWPEIGTNYTQLAEVCSRYGAGMRLTNESNDYGLNFATTRWFASACRHHGIPFGFEPAGGISLKGNVLRIYNALSSGSEHIQAYATNVMWEGNLIAGAEAFIRYRPLLKQTSPQVGAAVFFPKANIALERSLLDIFLSRAAQMRDALDFNFVDEGLIRSGALPKNGVLFLLAGTVTYPDVLEIIRSWINNGGTLVTLADCIGEGPRGTAAWKSLIGNMAEVELREVASVSHEMPEHYCLDINEFPPQWGWYPTDIWFFSGTSEHYQWSVPVTEDEVPAWSGPLECYRWSMPTATIEVPARPETNYELVLRVRIPKRSCNLKVGNRIIGHLAATNGGAVDQHFNIPSDLVEPAGISRLRFEMTPYLRRKDEPMSMDDRPLGLQLFGVRLRVSGSKAEPTSLMDRIQLNIEDFQRRCIRPVGNGRIVHYPGRWKDRGGYAEVLTSLIRERSLRLAPDGRFDKKYFTALKDRMLVYEKGEIHLG